MLRRKVRSREIPFSFDSFLDVVANVVGIIIRLILVVWVSARSYESVKKYATLAARTGAVVAPKSSDVTPAGMESSERELQELQARLAEALDRIGLLDRKIDEEAHTQSQLYTQASAVTQRRKALAHSQMAVPQIDVTSLHERERMLEERISALEKLSPVRHELRYRTPVSRPVQAEEIFFECRAGRVSFIDMTALTADIRRNMDRMRSELRDQWQVNAVTDSVGAFRLQYTLERDRALPEAVEPAGPPERHSGFRLSLSGWTVEPTRDDRGEELRLALNPGSEFHRIVDQLDPSQNAVTFWVYPDSFALYRTLRDVLYDRGLMVAGRPLPVGVPIMCSRQGTVSRGQ
jgi:hypothetical protein